MPANIGKQAYDALVQAQRHHYTQDGVTAIILYSWLLTAFQGNPSEVARLQLSLGNAYLYLPAGDRQVNLERAITCYEAALQVFHLTRMDYYLQVVSGNLKVAKDELQNLAGA